MNEAIIISKSDQLQMTATKLSAFTYEIKDKLGTPLVVDSVKNRIDDSNKLLDCDLFTCDYKVEITAKQAQTFNASTIEGKWEGEGISVQKTFFMDTMQVEHERLLYGEQTKEECHQEIGNTTVCANITRAVQTGVETYYTTEPYENTDLETPFAKDEVRTYVIRFAKDRIDRNVDIYHSIYGQDRKDAAWWNLSFTNKLIVNITGWVCSNPFCQYPINISLNSTITNGSDIRVIASDETTVLPYWRETANWSNTTAKGNIWVNASNNTAQVNIYYGANGVQDLSNGYGVFRFFDDFDAATLNKTGKWNVSGTPSYSVDNGILNFSSATFPDAISQNYSTGGLTVNYSIIARINMTLGRYSCFGSAQTACGSGNNNDFSTGQISTNSAEFYSHDGAPSTVAAPFLNNVPFRARLMINGTAASYFVNDFNSASLNETAHDYQGTQRLSMNVWNSVNPLRVDWVAIASMNYSLPIYNFSSETQAASAYNLTANYTTPEYDLVGYNHSISFSLNQTGYNINATFVFNGITYPTIKTIGSISINFTAVNIIPQSVQLNTSMNANWSYNISYPNGSLKSNSTAYNVLVVPSGVFPCNATYPNQTAAIGVIDDITSATLNTTHFYSITSIGGQNRTISSSNITTSLQFCIYPTTLNLSAYISDFMTVTGYLPKTTTATFQATGVPQSLTFTMTNSSQGAYYTFDIVNPFNSPIQGATVTAEKQNNTGFTLINSGTTDYLGAVIFPLQQLITYRINVSAAGYKMVNFTIVSASITTITVQMTSLSTTNLTGFQAWQDTEYLVSPNSGFYNTSQTLSFQVANNASTLDSWGMFIVKTNGSTSTVVFNSTSTVATGGTMTYVANPNATYTVYANFKRQGDNKYNIMPVVYHISTQSVGLAAIRDSLAGGNVISGWTFYFIASCISIGIGLAIYRFSGGSSVSAIGGVASLFFFSYLAPPDMYLFGSFVTPMMATITIAVGTIAAVYVTSNG